MRLRKRIGAISCVRYLSVFISILLLCCFSNLVAQEDAGQPGEFLRYGVGCRALGMGRAFVAVADDASAIYWNPAGLSTLHHDGPNLMFMWNFLYGGSTLAYFGLAIPPDNFIPFKTPNLFLRYIRNWNFGVGYVQLATKGFERRDEYNIRTGEFSDKQSAIIFSFARPFRLKKQNFGIGLNAKYISHSIAESRGSDFGLDFGLKYMPSFRWINLSCIAYNVNSPNIGFSSKSKDVIPPTAKVGLSLSPRTRHEWLNAALLSFDYDMISPNKRRNHWYFGIEYDLLNVFNKIPLKLRLGSNGSSEKFTFGINFGLPSLNIYLPQIDWASSIGEKHLEMRRKQISSTYTLPFPVRTCMYWYKRGIELFEGRKGDLGRTYFEQAKDAPNPTHVCCPISSRLRLGDITVLIDEDKVKGLKVGKGFYDEANNIRKCNEEITTVLNHISYLYYIQSLIYNEEFDKAIKICNKDRIWVLHQTNKDNDANVIYLKAYALYKKGEIENAINLLGRSTDYPLINYLLGLIYKESKKYSQAIEKFDTLIDINATVPKNIYIPYFKDGILLDDAHYQIAQCYADSADSVREAIDDLEKQKLYNQALVELSTIIRFYPDSEYNSEKRRVMESNMKVWLKKIKGLH